MVEWKLFHSSFLQTDITHLLVNLLFLRPGLEPVSFRVMCQRTAQQDRASEHESQEILPDVACNDGFPRVALGDMHDAFTLRICYLALLVQTLLSWQPNSALEVNTPSGNPEAIREPCSILWMTDKVSLQTSVHRSVSLFSFIQIFNNKDLWALQTARKEITYANNQLKPMSFILLVSFFWIDLNSRSQSPFLWLKDWTR